MEVLLLRKTGENGYWHAISGHVKFSDPNMPKKSQHLEAAVGHDAMSFWK